MLTKFLNGFEVILTKQLCEKEDFFLAVLDDIARINTLRINKIQCLIY